MIYAVTCLEANFLTWWTATSLPSAIFILSCVTQATLETRVCHSRAYFNSHPTPLLSFYLLLPAPSLHFHSRTLPHVDAIAPSYQNVLKRSGTRSVPLFFPLSLIWIDGAPRPAVCSRSVVSTLFLFLARPARSCFPVSTILSISVRCNDHIFFPYFFPACGTLVCSLCHLPVVDCQFLALGLLRISFIIKC